MQKPQAVVAKEVVRRKACVMEIGVEVNRLIASQKQPVELTQYINRIALENLAQGDFQQQVKGDDEEVIVSNTTSDVILSAKKLLYRGIKLIDDELYSIHNKGHLSSPQFDFWRRYHDFCQQNNDFYRQSIFLEEIRLQSIHFPNCFYFPPISVQQGDNFIPITRGVIQKASVYASTEHIALLVRG